MSYKPQFQTDSSGKWYSNAQAFATKEEAERSAYSRMLVWTAVRDYRAIESDEPVNYEIVDNQERHIESYHEALGVPYATRHNGRTDTRET